MNELTCRTADVLLATQGKLAVRRSDEASAAHKPSVIGVHRDVTQRARAVLCNGTPNCAAYNYILRAERDRGRVRPSLECQLLNSVDKPVSVFHGQPG